MKRRFIAALVVALAVLFSQGGGFVLAAICPNLRAAKPDTACHKNSPEVVAEHHQADEATGPAFDTAEVRCNHCVVPTRNKREEFVFQQPKPSQRADEQSSAPVVKIEPPSFVQTVSWNAKTQGPPGRTAPLHILLNVFRI